jgi:methionyl-tRNA synthetase
VSFFVYFAGLLLIAAVAWAVASPLFALPPPALAEAESPRDERWRKQKEEAVAAIKEAEFDLHLGKLSEHDYRQLRGRLEGKALEAIAVLEGDGGEMATLNEFQQLDLRVATVIAAEPHPNADRLLVLRIDLGGDERQIVAGIRANYEPSVLVGKQIVVVANLDPAKLRGIESQGMLLAARDGDRVVLMTPDSPVSAGSKVS